MAIKTCFLLTLALVLPAHAQDWPQWRGPARDGALKGAPRASWPETLTQAWRVPVGIGHAGPIVHGTRAYVFAREGEEEVLRALDLATGKTLWRQAYPAPYQVNSAASSHGAGPKSTPALAGSRIFTLGISGILSAFDEASGRLLWQYHPKRFKAGPPIYGAAMSPLVDGANVIAHVGGQDDGALLALDAATGAVRWELSGDGPGYASPVVAPLAGVRQVVTLTQKRLVGVAADGGALLWSVPFTTAYDQNAVTPVVAFDLVIYSGLDSGVRALRVVAKAGGFATEPAWQNPEPSAYMSTPVLVGDVLYGLSHKKKGQFFALDAKSGRTLWLSEGRQGENAALVASAGGLLMLTTESSLTVAKADPAAFSVLRTYRVGESPTWAHPALAGDAILVKDRDALTLWRPPPS